MNNQQESPFNNPKFVVSIITVFLFLWGWQYYVNKKYPPIKFNKVNAETKVENNQSNLVSAPSNKADNTITNINPTDNIEKIYTYEDDKIKWAISSYGMGLNYFELKQYFDKEKHPISFTAENKLFAIEIDSNKVFFDLKKINDYEYIGSASVNGRNFKRIINYNKETMAFESIVEFDTTPETILFSTSEVKHKVESSNFLMPSFEIQDFLYKNNEKIITENISGLKDSDSFNKEGLNVSLASIGTQYFTQSFIDKSDIMPSINMTVMDKIAKLGINYNLVNTKINKIKNIIYIGPKSNQFLEPIDPILPEVMNYGIFGFISKPLLTLMKFLFEIFGNWGVAIIALTIIMRLLMLPFNILSFKSARAMQKIQPQLNAIRERYKGDPMAVNRETMALMKEHNANPLSSCLPMLIQIPIFFALWKTIGSSIEIYQQPFFGWITDLSSYDHFFVLPILMGITMFFQQKLTPTTMDPMQAKILNFMPILFSIFMISLPSGLTLYNFISALFGVVQQYFLLNNKT